MTTKTTEERITALEERVEQVSSVLTGELQSLFQNDGILVGELQRIDVVLAAVRTLLTDADIITDQALQTKFNELMALVASKRQEQAQADAQAQAASAEPTKKSGTHSDDQAFIFGG